MGYAVAVDRGSEVGELLVDLSNILGFWWGRGWPGWSGLVQEDVDALLRSSFRVGGSSLNLVAVEAVSGV